MACSVAKFEDAPIPGTVWRAETHHRKLWQSQGACTRCRLRPRDLMCGKCGAAMCPVCLIEHGKEPCGRKRKKGTRR